jgi:hypothetical protein
MLRARAHLRKQARPVLGCRAYVHPSLDPIASDPGIDDRQREDHRSGTVVDDVGVRAVERDAQLEAPSCVGEVTVPEIHPEQVGVRIVVCRADHERMFPSGSDGIMPPER